MSAAAERFAEAFGEIRSIGRRADGGYDRFSLSASDAALRSWFVAAAGARGLEVERDANTNLWAWWRDGDTDPDPTEDPSPDRPAVATGSHLDSVASGGGFDGALGVVSALLAFDELRARGARPRRPIALCVFSEEEGARFGVACLGSRLMTGAIDPARARGLEDAKGETLEGVLARAGVDPGALGAERDQLARIGAFVELHIEQGRRLVDLGSPVGIGASIWPHGRWRFDIIGEPDHAGTTRLENRRDPVLCFAETALAAREIAVRRDALATFGRVEVRPGAANALASRVDAWLDARARDDDTLDSLVADVRVRADESAAVHGTHIAVEAESRTAGVVFDAALRGRMEGALRAELGRVPALETGAGHDAGVLSAVVPAGMLFVRNPSGVSHSPAEHATDEDCALGVHALSLVLEELACS